MTTCDVDSLYIGTDSAKKNRVVWYYIIILRFIVACFGLH
jgi:hypothetical protein